MALILSGKELARETTRSIKAMGFRGAGPGLAVVLVGDDPASRVYVSSKEKACGRAGIRSIRVELPADAGEEALIREVQRLNRDPDVHGILCQLPLPPGYDRHRVASAIAPAKDVDGLHPENVGKLWRGEDGLFPCTPLGMMELLRRHDISPHGMHGVIVGRSDIVGKPMAALLLREHCTVTLAHSRTSDLQGLCRTADILVAAVGRPGMIRADWVKPRAVVLDVGINRLDDGTITGDVDFAGVEPLVSAITPVPGGVGPLTIAFLLRNTVKAWELSAG